MADVQIPKEHKACIYDNPGTVSTKVEMIATPEPGPGECLIHLEYSGVCHSDLGLMQNEWKTLPPIQAGQVGGHEGVGKVVKLGSATEKSSIKVGDRVGIKWLSYACGDCPPCLNGHDALCHNQKISGYYTPGTFQQYALGPVSYVSKIPDGLGSAEAAPMLCSGVTVYQALRKSGAKSGDFVVVQGAGGGLGDLALQIGRTMGLRMIGIDADAKKQFCLDAGAEAFVGLSAGNEGMEKQVKELSGGLGVHAVLTCTAANEAYAVAHDYLRFGGTLVVIGVPEGTPQPIASALPQKIIFAESRIVGTAVGTRKDAVDVLDLAARGLVKSHFRIEKMDKLTDVFNEMKSGKLSGRVVLDLS